jgi:hypothetical protein
MSIVSGSETFALPHKIYADMLCGCRETHHDIEPAEAVWPEWPGVGEGEYTTADILAHVVEVWVDRVCAPPEVQIVGEIKPPLVPEFPRHLAPEPRSTLVQGLRVYIWDLSKFEILMLDTFPHYHEQN